MTTDDNASCASLNSSSRALAKCSNQYKLFLSGRPLFPPLLAIGAGLVLMGLMRRSTHDN